MTTRSELVELSTEYRGDVQQMQRCLMDAGYEATDDELVLAWSLYSKSLCAGWLSLPKDQDLIQILLKQLPGITVRTEIKHVHLLAAPDASGDALIRLSKETLMQLGWSPGDEIDVSTAGEGALLLRHRNLR